MCVESSIKMRLFLSRLLSFPTNVINASDTRLGFAKAFGMWSDVSPFSFREVPADQEADIKIGWCSSCGCIDSQQTFLGVRLLFFSLCCQTSSITLP